MPYTWDPISKRYRDPKGRYIPGKTIRGLLNIAIDTKTVTGLTRSAKQGVISSDTWRIGMREVIKKSYLQSAMLAKGGREAMTAADWGKVGGHLAEQYKFLDLKVSSFFEVLDGLTEKQAIARARMYVNSARQVYEDINRQNKLDIGAVFEKWVKSPLENCEDCIALASLGIVPIGTLWTVPGAGQTICLTNCGCRIAYYNQKKRVLAEFFLGGAGSGNWGHAGRPGRRGGSLPRSTAMAISAKDWKKRQQQARGFGNAVKIPCSDGFGNNFDVYEIPKNTKIPKNILDSDQLVIMGWPGLPMIIGTDEISHAELTAGVRRAADLRLDYDSAYRVYIGKDEGALFISETMGKAYSPERSDSDIDQIASRNIQRFGGELIDAGVSPSIPATWTVAEGSDIRDLTLGQLVGREDMAESIMVYTPISTQTILQHLLTTNQAFSVYFTDAGMVFALDEAGENGHLVHKLGGAGSGNYGHAGRPGKRGGSLPRPVPPLSASMLEGFLLDRFGEVQLYDVHEAGSVWITPSGKYAATGEQHGDAIKAVVSELQGKEWSPPIHLETEEKFYEMGFARFGALKFPSTVYVALDIGGVSHKTKLAVRDAISVIDADDSFAFDDEGSGNHGRDLTTFLKLLGVERLSDVPAISVLGEPTYIRLGEHTGAMIALHIPKQVAEALELPGGEKPEDMHITLLYLGDVSEIADRRQVEDSLEDFVKNWGAFEGSIHGLGRFNASKGSDNKDVLYATVDSYVLPALRQAIVETIEDAADIKLPSDHGFIPHITLQYFDSDADLPVQRVAEMELEFDAIYLHWGDEVKEFKFEGGTDLYEHLFGGPGSGNYGHAGRPGKRGGSASRKSVLDAYYTGGGYVPLPFGEGASSLAAGRMAMEELRLKGVEPFYEGDQKKARGSRNPGDIAVLDYSRSGYLVNDLLRGRLSTEDLSSSEDLREKLKTKHRGLAKDLQERIATEPLPISVVSYRFAGETLPAKLEAMKPGELFVDQGFVSVTVNSKMDWPGHTDIGKRPLRVLAPKGTKALFVGGASVHPSDAELILQRGMQYKYLGVIDGLITVEAVAEYGTTVDALIKLGE